MSGLKKYLNQVIKSRGEVTFGEMCQITAQLGYKVNTAERRLRESPNVIPIKRQSKRGTWYISAYKWNSEGDEEEIKRGEEFEVGKLSQQELREMVQ